MVDGRWGPLRGPQLWRPKRRGSWDAVPTCPLGLSASQVAAVQRGEVVALANPASLDREIAISGAIRIRAPAERTVAQVRDIERFESGPHFRHTRRLSEPPRIEEFGAFRLSKDDLAALRRCRPGDCDVNLGARGFAALARVDWSAPDAADQANTLARQTAFEYLRAYRSGGNPALAVYLDRKRPLAVADEFAGMMSRSGRLPELLPALSEYLVGHPAAARPARTEDFYYWSEADFGLKPVFRINWVVIHTPQEKWALLYAIATKQLYANHYFHTALELRLVVDDDREPGRAHYLLVLSMARSDGMTGLLGGVVRSRVRDASRSALQRSLVATKLLVEEGRLP